MAKTGRTCRNSRKKKCLKARATDFVVVSAQETETPAMKYRESLTLTEEGTELFVHAVLNPPPPSDAVRAAARRYKEQIGR